MVSALTLQISDPAPLMLDCQPERHRRVRCIWFVRPSVSAYIRAAATHMDHLRNHLYSSYEGRQSHPSQDTLARSSRNLILGSVIVCWFGGRNNRDTNRGHKECALGPCLHLRHPVAMRKLDRKRRLPSELGRRGTSTSTQAKRLRDPN